MLISRCHYLVLIPTTQNARLPLEYTYQTFVGRQDLEGTEAQPKVAVRAFVALLLYRSSGSECIHGYG